MQVDLEIGNRVGQRCRTLDRSPVHAVLHHHRLERGAREDRLSDDPVLPRHDIAVRVHAALEQVIVERAVGAGAHVVFAGPHQLHRRATVDGLGDGRGFDQLIGVRIGPPPEAPAGVEHIELDLLGFQSEDARHNRLIDTLELLPIPHFTAASVEPHDAIHRFHRGMRKVGKFEPALDRLGCSG